MDGSVDNDLPMTRLSEMFNVNHFIVSQVNPHVVPFLDSDNVKTGQSGIQPPNQTVADSSGLWSALGGIAKSELLFRMHLLTEFGVFPTTLTKFRSVMSQKYSGDITILPQISLYMVPRVLQNPDPPFMEQALMSGERATWPKLSRIRNHLSIELAIDEAIQKLMRKMAFSPSQVNLRMMSLNPAKHAETDRAREARLFSHSRAKTKSWCVETNLTHLSQLTTQFKDQPRRDEQEKLHSSTLQFIPKRTEESEKSISDSDDEDNTEDFFLLNLSSRSRRKRPLESSPEPATYDSSTSNIRSHSPSPTGSPDPVTAHSQRPVLWPVPARLGLPPPASQPVSPFTSRNRRRSSPEMLSPALSMSLTRSAPEPLLQMAGPMSEAERKYKKLFHHDGSVHTVPVHAGGLSVDISGTRAMLLRRKLSRGSEAENIV
jgi:TAG lipase/steryl ester hydrolase/phospholipase A2/LPA acyltransferase